MVPRGKIHLLNCDLQTCRQVLLVPWRLYKWEHHQASLCRVRLIIYLLRSESLKTKLDVVLVKPPLNLGKIQVIDIAPVCALCETEREALFIVFVVI